MANQADAAADGEHRALYISHSDRIGGLRRWGCTMNELDVSEVQSRRRSAITNHVTKAEQLVHTAHVAEDCRQGFFVCVDIGNDSDSRHLTRLAAALLGRNQAPRFKSKCSARNVRSYVEKRFMTEANLLSAATTGFGQP